MYFRLTHHFQGACEYTLAMDCRKETKSGFHVQVRNSDKINNRVTVTEAVAVRLPGGSTAELTRSTHLLNGQPLPALPFTDVSIVYNNYLL